ncbi:MAG: ABC transporter permease [Chloroflexi bacterium]|nr:ABC transporter permease [Chloroflexota bacterium]
MPIRQRRGQVLRPRSPWQVAAGQLRRNRGAIVGLAAFVLILGLTLLSPLITPYDPVKMSASDYLKAPSLAHLFGTDRFGRDILSRTLAGGRISLAVGLVSVVIAAVGGALLGAVAGYFGGLVDGAIMRFVDVLLSFPGLLLALGIVALLGPGINNVILAVGISGVTGYARLVRGCVLSAREEPYIEAAHATGCGAGRILLRHLLPNIIGPVIVLSTLDVAWAILTASSLSFLGLGAQPPTPEWGAMLNEGRGLLVEAPWLTVFPGLMIMITVLSVNIFGDGLRDAVDPRMRGSS